VQPLLQWKAVSVTQPVGAFVVLGIQHAMRVSHFVFCGLSSSANIFPHFFHKSKIFEKKVVEHKMCVLSFSITFV